MMTGEPEEMTPTPQGQPGPRRLLQPEYSMPTGLYAYANFPMGVTLTQSESCRDLAGCSIP